MSKSTKGFFQFVKRVFLKYFVGYGNEQRYWNSRWKLNLKDEYWSEERKQETIEFLEKIMSDNEYKTFLDVGCGKAEIKNLKGYVGLDFSLESIKRSNLKEAIFADITNHIPLPEKSFDVVFTNAVLLHIPPNKIEKAVSEITRVANKVLILKEPEYDPNNTHIQKHCFNHDLNTMVKKYFNGKLMRI